MAARLRAATGGSRGGGGLESQGGGGLGERRQGEASGERRRGDGTGGGPGATAACMY